MRLGSVARAIAVLSLCPPAFALSPHSELFSLAAQQTVVAGGRVVRVSGQDTIGIPAAKVILHRVGRAIQGPIDSTTAGRRGEFRFRFRADTTAIYLLSSGYAGIEYFSTPVHLNPVLPDTGLLLLVSDTSSTTPISVASRHIVVSKPGKDGTRSTLEIVVLMNAGNDTRVAGDSSHPSWSGRLPTGALDLQVGQGDVSPEAFAFRHDSVLLFAPIAPGEKQLLYTYQIPASPGRVRIPIGDSIQVLNVLLEEVNLRVSGAGISKADSQRIEGRTFQQWTGPVAPGTIVQIDFPGDRARWILAALVGALGLGLVAALARSLRRRPANAVPQLSLLDQLARLDTQYAGRQAEVTSTEWADYQSERALLKAGLAAELAATDRLS
jgi:hypothetical protein